MFLLIFIPFVRMSSTIRISTMAQSPSVSNLLKQKFQTLLAMVDMRWYRSADTLSAWSNATSYGLSSGSLLLLSRMGGRYLMVPSFDEK